MARKSLKDLRNAFKSSNDNNNESRPSNYYPFFSMEYDEKAILRFLPDLNEENPLGFLVEKLSHTLNINGEKKTVPCLKMYGEESCPICTASQQFYKDEGDDTVNGKRLYRRKQHLAQVLVIEDPLKYKEGEETAHGKVKLVNIGYSIYNKIKEAFEEDDLEEVPWDYEEGTDFMIKKTLKGKWANYDGSKFVKRERALSDDEMAAIEGNLIDLHTLLPKQPTLERVQSLIDADLNGDVYEESSKPASKPTESSKPDSKPTESSKPKPSKAESKADDDVDEEDDFADEADDILADIRKRRNAQ